MRFLGNNLQKASSALTHLIIDEVHERSVDTDLLCLFTKRLLACNNNVRVILMSATICTELYKTYFDVPVPHIFVGARRFPVTEYFSNDIAQVLGMNKVRMHTALNLTHATENPEAHPADKQISLDQCSLAVAIVQAVGLSRNRGGTGSAILIFVAGIMEIERLIESFDELNLVASRKSSDATEFWTIPIHSDVPFEDQMRAFDVPSSTQVKVVIATNAAESSVTIPDCDHVICLGSNKQIVYNSRTHREQVH